MRSAPWVDALAAVLAGPAAMTVVAELGLVPAGAGGLSAGAFPQGARRDEQGPAPGDDGVCHSRRPGEIPPDVSDISDVSDVMVLLGTTLVAR
jgi:hypothetical protein